jgi:uncharacterized protein with HEPN domain
MDKPTPKHRLEHVLEAIELIGEFIIDVDEKTFSQDIKLQSAVQYQFLIIGEAIRHVDDDILNKYDYPWHIPRSFRNFIIHVYHNIKIERVYYAAQNLEALKNEIQNIIDNEF